MSHYDDFREEEYARQRQQEAAQRARKAGVADFDGPLNAAIDFLYSIECKDDKHSLEHSDIPHAINSAKYYLKLLKRKF